jgi:glycosyltransferase involved in cell wall biosynthesis
MLRIAVITTGFSKDEADHSGASFMHNFIRELSRNNIAEVTVFALYYPYDSPEYEFYNTKVFSFGSEPSHGKTAKLKIWRKCRVKFEKEHTLKPFDVIHSFWSGESGYVSAGLSKKLGIPLITTICGGEAAKIPGIKYGSQLKFWQKYFVRKTCQQAKVIIALSEYISDKMKDVYKGKFFNKVKIAPFGTDEKMFYPYGSNLITRKLINIAGALPVKSHRDLFMAFKIVYDKFPDYILECSGRNDKGTLEELAKDCGVYAVVRINGFIDYEKIPNVLNGADKYVLSSLYEAQNMSIVEAAFCGLPVVSTDVGSAREITAHLADAGDHQKLAEKIIYVIENLEEEKQKNLAKIETLKSKFSLKNSVNNFLKIYKSLAK